MAVVEKKIKEIEYYKDDLRIFNNIDIDVLNYSTKFPISSVSKLFTFILTLILIEKEELRVNDQIDKYIDSDTMDFNNISVNDLLLHTSGLAKEVRPKRGIKMNRISILDFVHLNLITSNQGSFRYSNIGYQLLGKIIEKITGKRFHITLKELILEPLNMKSTGVVDKLKLRLYHNDMRVDYNDLLLSYGNSAYGIYSCMNDMIKFGNFPTLLSGESIEMLKNSYMYNATEDQYQHTGLNYGCKMTFILKKDIVYCKFETNTIDF